MIHIGDRRCRKAGGREDGEGTALAGHHELSVTTMTVLTGCHVFSWTGSHCWDGVVWFGKCTVKLVWVGMDPIVTRCNGENGSGNLPHQIYVANSDCPDCHTGVLGASRRQFLSEKLGQEESRTMYHGSKGSALKQGIG